MEPIKRFSLHVQKTHQNQQIFEMYRNLHNQYSLFIVTSGAIVGSRITQIEYDLFLNH